MAGSRIDPSRADGAIDHQRRRLVAMLAAGVFAAGCAPLVGRRPVPLGPDRSVWRADGAFTVNGATATPAIRIGPGDAVDTTGALVFAVGSAAFLARAGTRLRLRPRPDDPDAVGSVEVERGGLLSVYGGGRHRIDLPLAIVNIRGTGLYVQVEEGADYVCTCYGETLIQARTDATSSASIIAQRHDQARYVRADGSTGGRVVAAPFKDHDDQELLLLETLVGREPPYPVPADGTIPGRAGSY